MPSTSKKSPRAAANLETSSNGASFRIDPPHVVDSEVSVQEEVAGNAPVRGADQLNPSPDELDPVSVIEAAAGRNPTASAEQMRIQASQLAEYLRARQRELDEREAQLNSLEAKFKNESRTSRLWVRERDQEFTERENEYRAKIAELEARAAHVSIAALSTDRDSSELTQRLELAETELARRQQSLDSYHQELASAAAVLEREKAEWQSEISRSAASFSQERIHCQSERELSERTIKQLMRDVEELREALAREQTNVQTHQKSDVEIIRLQLQRDFEQRDASLRERATHLAQRECQCDEQWNACERERRQFEVDRERSQQELENARRQFIDQRTAVERDTASRQGKLRERELKLDQEAAALDQLRAEVSRQHHETLELRLVMEQLWAQLAGRLGVAESTQAVAKLRARLAEEYRETKAALAEQAAELQQLSERLEEQQLALRKQRKELQEWVVRRHEEIEEQATRLVAHEQEVESERQRCVEIQEQCEQERFALKKQIRELAAQLRTRSAAA